MKEKLLEGVVHKYLDITEEDIVKGHYIDTDFQRYSQVVEDLVQIVQKLQNEKGYQPVLFTTLCLPLFQWFNFNATGVSENSNINKIDSISMQCDGIWSEYLAFAHNILKPLDLYRCILCVEDNVEIKEEFRLVKKSIIIEQAQAKIIVKKSPSLLEPLNQYEIADICETLGVKYDCYNKGEMAYLIVDKDVPNFPLALKEHYDIEELSTFFRNQFHKSPNHAKWRVFDKNEYDSWRPYKEFPEDFFMIGEGEIQNRPEWCFGLAAKVINFEKVRLWFIGKGLEAREFKFNGGKEYVPVFAFDDIVEFINMITDKEKWENF